MDPYRESLARRYAELDDADLLRRLEQGELADIPLEIAQAELQSRGLALTPHALRPPPNLDFPPDSFAANPYQPPHARSDETADAPSGRAQISAVLWWVYIAILGALALRSAYVSALRPSGVTPAPLFSFGVIAWNCIGLVGWRLRKPLLWRWLWAISALLTWLTVALMALAGVVMALLAANDPAQWRIVWIATGTFLMLLPLAWGMSTYAFHEKTIW